MALISVTTAKLIRYTEMPLEPSKTFSKIVQIMGDKPPNTAAATCTPKDAPDMRTLVPKSSGKYAACGPYMGAWQMFMNRAIASMMVKLSPLFTRINRGYAQIMLASAPVIYRIRRPILSESHPKNGKVNSSRHAPNRTPLRATLFGRLSVFETYATMKIVRT